MSPFVSQKELKKRCKNPSFCMACFRVRKGVEVDQQHICLDCRRGSAGMPIRLPVITLKDGKSYFIDDRLCEYRHIHDPCDRIRFRDFAQHAPTLHDIRKLNREKAGKIPHKRI